MSVSYCGGYTADPQCLFQRPLHSPLSSAILGRILEATRRHRHTAAIAAIAAIAAMATGHRPKILAPYRPQLCSFTYSITFMRKLPSLAIPRHSSPFLGDFGLGGFFCHPLNKYLPFFCYMTFTRVPMRVYIGHTGFFDILWHHYNFIIIFFVSPSQIFTDSIETTLIFFVYLYFAFLSLSLSLSLSETYF